MSSRVIVSSLATSPNKMGHFYHHRNPSGSTRHSVESDLDPLSVQLDMADKEQGVYLGQSYHNIYSGAGDTKTPFSPPPSRPSLPLKFNASFTSLVHSRSPRHRMTFFALFALISISTFVFFFANPATFMRTPMHGHPNVSSSIAAVVSPTKAKSIAQASGYGNTNSAIDLTAEQELAAVTFFLASLSQNVIPSSVDPSEPIHPELVLDFDTRGSRASEMVEEMVEETWTRNPVVIYAKYYSPIGRELKSMINSFNLKPTPTIFDVDLRDDFDVLPSLVLRLTSQADLPILLIGGTPVGTIEEIRTLYENGTLKEMVSEAGAIVDGAKRRKGRRMV